MGETRRDADPLEEALRAHRGDQLGIQELERNLPIVLEIVREIDSCHPAGADFTLDGVPASEYAIQVGDCIHTGAGRRGSPLRYASTPGSGTGQIGASIDAR